MIVKNGILVLEDELLTDHSLVLEGDRIRDILPDDEVDCFGHEILDADGAYVMPGFVDIHSDYLEGLASPRPTALMPFNLALRECERILITHGITTMFHSLSMYKDDLFEVKAIRKSENTLRLIEEIDRIRNGEHLLHHRVHARLEVDNIDFPAVVRKLIRENKIHLLSFMDHTPGQGQYRDLEVYVKTLQGYRNIDRNQVLEIVNERKSKAQLSLSHLKDLASFALEQGISVASHDDDSTEKLDLIAGFGAVISEFPITLEVAHAARQRGLYTVAGAPNIILGGSHSGNLSAAEGILAGDINILCSDYYPASLVHSIFHMHRMHGIPIYEMVKMLTLHPSNAVGLGDRIGSIAPGKIADLICVRPVNGLHAVSHMIVEGVQIYQMEYRHDTERQ